MITPQPMPPDQPKAPKLLDQVWDKIRLKHYNLRAHPTATGRFLSLIHSLQEPA